MTSKIDQNTHIEEIVIKTIWSLPGMGTYMWYLKMKKGVVPQIMPWWPHNKYSVDQTSI